MKKIILAMLLLVSMTFTAEAKDICGIDDEMKVPSYWICRAQRAKTVMMTQAEIKKFNEKIRADESLNCRDVLSMPLSVSKSFVQGFITDKAFEGKMYVGKNETDAAFWNDLIANANIDGIKENTKIRFGTAVLNDIIKIMPCDDEIYDKPGTAQMFDENVQSAVKIWEPLAVLHESLDGEFYLVVSSYCSGWIKKDAVALSDRETLKKYEQSDFYVVTSNRAETDIRTEDPNAGRRVFYMGTRLPAANADIVDGISTICSRTVLVPLRRDDGTLTVITERIPFSGGSLSHGYLPYTQTNIINQAFKMLGERYGWGGTFGARDCSGLVRDVYLTFGIDLPRNSKEQSNVPAKIYSVEKKSDREKINILKKAPSGTLVYFPGHIMIYIGTDHGRHYVIQSVSRCITPNSRNKMTPLNCVVISGLDVKRANKKTFLENATKIITID